MARKLLAPNKKSRKVLSFQPRESVLPMAMVFCDSFDTTNQFPGGKWSSGAAGFAGSPVRTGSQSMTAFEPGFANLPRVNFSNRTTLIAGFAWYPQGSLAAVNMFLMYNAVAGSSPCELLPGGDGSIALHNSGNFVTQSAPGVLSVNSWNYVECKATMTASGSCIVRVNGEVVIDYTGPLQSPGAITGADGVMLTGSSAVSVYYDDFYLFDNTGGVNDDFAGAVRIYAIYPDADETPLDFAPLADLNYQEVNQFPPPGDDAYVFGASSGDVDQYHYTVTGPTGSYSILAVQHSLSCKLDAAGSHTVASQVNSHTGGTPNVGSDAPVEGTYNYVITPYDTNPNTSAAFEPTDFATTFFGPNITS
jgi:hypothetical protein